MFEPNMIINIDDDVNNEIDDDVNNNIDDDGIIHLVP